MIHPSLLIVKLGGALLDDATALAATIDSIADLHRARPGSVAVVHGGGISVDRHLSRIGMRTEKRDGIRITPPEQMIEIASVLNGQVNTAIVAALLSRGAAAVGLSIADGFTTNTGATTRHAFDPGCVGEIRSGHPRLIRVLLQSHFLPVISSVAVGADGTLLNVNADDAAAGIAKICAADRLVFLTDVSGVLDHDGALIDTIDSSRAAELIESGVISGGMIPKVNNALATAADIGVAVVIAGWRDRDVLTRIASGERIASSERIAAGESVGTTILPPIHDHFTAAAHTNTRLAETSQAPDLSSSSLS